MYCKYLTCPHCGYTSDESDFPDLFYEDSNHTKTLNKQAKLLEKMQSKGFNLVTCGACGQVFIHQV